MTVNIGGPRRRTAGRLASVALLSAAVAPANGPTVAPRLVVSRSTL